ncbi:MAG: hypothetical protein ACRD3F_11180 [Acidobacteriaceae bacterium]
MMKFRRGMFATVVLALLTPVCVPAVGQQAANGMSAADRGMVKSRSAEIAEGARIYGYDLGAGNWTIAEARCAALPNVILLHYRRDFADGAQSRFTAVAPRGAGRVRIVPVLHHNMTPFVPAAANPGNYALFNELVREAGGGARGKFQLSGCYAELTGGDAGPLPGRQIDIAGAPEPMLHLEPERKTSSVTLASRATPERYQVWSVSFGKKGQVTKAATDYRVPSEESVAEKGEARTSGPGWKFIPQPPDPPSKFIPALPDPMEKKIPN